MVNKRFKKKIQVVVIAAALALPVLPAYAAENVTMSGKTAGETESETQSETQPPTETVTEAATEASTVAGTETSTEGTTETQTQPPTESDASSESETSGIGETQTETGAESETQQSETIMESETVSEAETSSESETASESESKKESEKETEIKSEIKVEKMEVVEEKTPIAELYVDPNNYPTLNVTENTKALYRFLREELELNHAAACGVLANIQMESNFNPLAIGDGGTSYGFCQWHLGRLTNLMNYCGSNGLDYHTSKGQMVYMKHELENAYPGVLAYIRSVPDTDQGAYDAAYHWCMYYEIPSQTAARSAQRGNLAKNEYYPQEFSLDEDEVSGVSGTTTSRINVRKNADILSGTLGKLNADTEVRVYGVEGDWYQIEYGEGYGYISSDYVELEEETENLPELSLRDEQGLQILTDTGSVLPLSLGQILENTTL